MYTEERSPGWTTFVTIVVGVAGGWNLILGIAALTKREYFDQHQLLYDNLTAWGWIWIVIGALQVLTAILIARRATTGRALGLIGASVSMLVWFFSLGAHPVATVLVIALDALVLYALTAERPHSAWSDGRGDVTAQRSYEAGRHFG